MTPDGLCDDRSLDRESGVRHTVVPPGGARTSTFGADGHVGAIRRGGTQAPTTSHEELQRKSWPEGKSRANLQRGGIMRT